MDFLSNVSKFVLTDKKNPEEIIPEDSSGDIEEEELPLLEELDIDFKLCFKKIKNLLFLTKDNNWSDPDFTGPFCIILMISLLTLLFVN